MMGLGTCVIGADTSTLGFATDLAATALSFSASASLKVARWEIIAVTGACLERHCEVHVVYIFFSPLAEVPDKSVNIVSLGHLDRAVLVELYTI